MGGTQFFAFAENGQIVTTEELCVGVSNHTSLIIMVPCSDTDSTQQWKYDNTVSNKRLY